MSVLSSGVTTPSSGRDYRHDGLLYDDDEHLTRVAASFLRVGLDAGEAAVIATTPRAAEALRDAVGEHPLLYVLDRHEAYRARTPTAITTFRRLAAQHADEGVPQVRVIGEVDFGRTDRDWLEWQRYESVINEALSDWPLWGLCVFDTQRLPQPLLDSAAATHSTLLGTDGRAANPSFIDPAIYLRTLPVPDEPLENTPPRLSAPDVSDFVGVRHAVAAELATSGANADLAEDFLLAVDEMVSNAVRHGLPPVSLRLWIADDRVVCTISDGGPGWDNPFAGYGPAHGEDLSRGGMGLWLARQLCDHVDISGGQGQPGQSGVQVRLTIRLR